MERILIAIFLLVAVSTARAQDPLGLSAGFGLASVGSEVCLESMILSQELNERKWLASLATHGTGTCREQEMRGNIGISILRTVEIGKWSLGFGGQVWEHGDRAVGPREDGDRIQLSAGIGIRRYIFLPPSWDLDLTLDILHSSTGGSTEYNAGRNFLVLSAYF